MYASVLAAGLTMAAAQQPQRCSAPPTWQAKTSFYDPVRQGAFVSNYFYDETQERTVIQRFIFDPRAGRLQESDSYYLHRDPTGPHEYRYNHTTKSCSKIPLTRPFRPFQIFQNASFYSAITLGAPGIPNAGVNVNLWGETNFDPATQRPRFHWEGQFTSVGCVPVHEFFLDFDTTPADYAELNWYDTVVGISNPNVFIPPSVCYQNAEIGDSATVDKLYARSF